MKEYDIEVVLRIKADSEDQAREILIESLDETDWKLMLVTGITELNING